MKKIRRVLNFFFLSFYFIVLIKLRLKWGCSVRLIERTKLVKVVFFFQSFYNDGERRFLFPERYMFLRQLQTLYFVRSFFDYNSLRSKCPRKGKKNVDLKFCLYFMHKRENNCIEFDNIWKREKERKTPKWSTWLKFLFRVQAKIYVFACIVDWIL